MYTLVQDKGRSGYQSSGIPVGGALDRTSAAAANWCVGNPDTTPVLEITMIGPQIRFEGPCQIAVTGAEIPVKLNDVHIERYRTVTVDADSILSFGRLRSGCRAYLAVRGEWQVTRWLESASALRIGDVDLVAGGVISKNDAIRIEMSGEAAPELHHPEAVTSWPEKLIVHVMAGPEFKLFSAQQIAFFFNTVFSISGESNRIGYRLEPSLPDYAAGKELISSGIIPGTVQITRQGQPIVMLADGQTTGGYPRIANVKSEDLDAIAQLRPGNALDFQIIKG